MLELIRNLIDSFGYIIFIIYLLTRFQKFKKIIKMNSHSSFELFILILVFSSFAVLGTYMGIDYKGAIANTRNISVVIGALLGGPIVGFFIGLIAGIHRFFIDPHGIAAIPCAFATFLGGWLIGYFKIIFKEKNIYVIGFFSGVIIENINMISILIFSKPFYLALNIVETLYLPMVLINGFGVLTVFLIRDALISEEDRRNGREAKLVLEIANKTLPYFQEINGESFNKVSKVIGEFLEAKAVVFTNEFKVIGSYITNDKYSIDSSEIKGKLTKEVLLTGKLKIVSKDNKKEMKLDCFQGKFSSLVIAPLTSSNSINGVFKVYFDSSDKVSSKKKKLIEGLSKLISTQLEISRIKQLEEVAREAEIKALQTQINPHFLFNALNTITSYVRIDPDLARSTITNLASYLRYNLEHIEKTVPLKEELDQVDAYINIEKARFGDKFNIHYKIDEGLLSFKIPSLIIQPLIENAIKHGVLKSENGKNIFLSIYRLSKTVIRIEVVNDGNVIPQNIIDEVYNDTTKPNNIGLYNVHKRLKLIYGRGLEIIRLTNPNGTKIVFDIKEDCNELYYS